MRVEQLPGMEAEQIARLQAAGINNCRQLLRASQRREQVLNLASATGLSPNALENVVRRAEVCQIRGVGKRTLVHLFEAGVDSLDALAAHEPETLRAELGQVTARPPNLAVIEDWILQARQKNGPLAATSVQAGLPP